MMDEDAYDKPPTHVDSIREAWHEFAEAVSFQAFCLNNPDPFENGGGLPLPIAWLCAPWKPLAWRFSRYNLERLLRPQKAERRECLDHFREYVFVCGAEDVTDEKWALAETWVAEFGGELPPRDWEPMSVAETVGAIMGMSREDVAEIVA